MAHTKSLPRPEAREADTAHSHIWFRGLVSVRTASTGVRSVWPLGPELLPSEPLSQVQTSQFPQGAPSSSTAHDSWRPSIAR